MKIDTYLNKNVIIITDHIHKKKILKYASKNHIILSCKIYTIEEVKTKYLFTYHEKAILEIIEKEKVLPSIAEIYMHICYYLEEKTYKSEKIQKLSQLFEHLKNENLVKKDLVFPKFMRNKTIILYELENIENADKKIFQKLSSENKVITLEEEEKDFCHTLYTFDNIEEEIAHLASTIASLINQNIDKNHIKVILLNDDYKNVIKRVFTLYHIPFQIKEKKPLISYDITKYFLYLLEEIEDKKEIPFLLSENYDLKDPFLKEIHRKLINILNKYDFIENKDKHKQIIKYICSKESIEKEEYENIIEVTSLYQDDIEQEDFLFLIGASLSYFPKIYKDDDYINDKEKEELELDSTLEKNKKEKEKLRKFLNTHKNIKISYAKFSSTKEYAKADIIEELIKEGKLILKEKEDIAFTKDFASYLCSKELDEFVKYNKVSKRLPILFHNISSKYKSYKHQYTPIEKEDFLSLIQNNITLSYTSLETFYKCRFRYYLQNIVKVKEEKEEDIERIFGLIVHEILESIENKKELEDILDSIIFSYYEKEKISFKEHFYIEKYKREIKRMLAILKKQQERSSFITKYLEKEFCENIDYKKLKVKLIGKIDKVCLYKEKGKIYGAIIDYKTGSTHFDINKIYYGLNMQLFIYYYLLKKKENISFAGVYLQNIIKDILQAKPNKTYEELLYEAYKLDGFTIKNRSIVKALDKEEKNSYIKNMRFKTDGDFYSNAKVLEEQTIEKLTKMVKEKIEKAIIDIYNVDFKIDPKNIGFEKEEDQTGCKFCSFKDICFKEDTDINILPKMKNLEFLEGDVYE